MDDAPLDGDGEQTSTPITVQLPFREGEIRLLEVLVRDLRSMLTAEDDDPSLRRLRPPAYEDAPEHEEAWRLIARSGLDDVRLAGVEVVERTLREGEATAAELHAWLTTLNSLRLVLGEQLDVRDDEHEPDFDGPDAQRWAIYEWLGATLDWLLRQLSAPERSNP